MGQRVWYGFNILITVADSAHIFGDNIKLYHIVEINQEHRRMRLIIRMSENHDKGTYSANDIVDRLVDP